MLTQYLLNYLKTKIMKQLKLVVVTIAIFALANNSFAQKNACSYFTANLTLHACAGDFRTFQVVTDICTEQMTVTASSSNTGDIPAVISSTIDAGTRKTTWNIGLQVAGYSGTPHTTKTYLRTITLSFNYLCCGVWYTQTRTIEVYDCPLR